jgi:hypothetical protein
MAADWSNTVQVSVLFSTLPPARAGFNCVLGLVDKATNTLGGSRVKTYTSALDVSTSLLATEISATTAAQLNAAFAQQPTPTRVKLANHDTGASETLTAALAAIEAVDTDWYGSCLYSRVAADIVTWAGLMETRKKVFVAQSADSSWLDSGVPSGFSTIVTDERTGVIYHDTAAQGADLAWLASRLVFDPDLQSAPFEGFVRSINAYATALTPAQRDFVVTNNANAGLPFSSAVQFYVSPGVNLRGRSLYEIVSADWFAARVSEDITQLRIDHTSRGEKILVDPSGQAKIMGILTARLQQGEAAGHFGKGNTRATAFPITDADRTAHQLRFKCEAQIGADARVFVVTTYLQASTLQAAA